LMRAGGRSAGPRASSSAGRRLPVEGHAVHGLLPPAPSWARLSIDLTAAATRSTLASSREPLAPYHLMRKSPRRTWQAAQQRIWVARSAWRRPTSLANPNRYSRKVQQRSPVGGESADTFPAWVDGHGRTEGPGPGLQIRRSDRDELGLARMLPAPDESACALQGDHEQRSRADWLTAATSSHFRPAQDSWL
jgi:hypothetical protein